MVRSHGFHRMGAWETALPPHLGDAAKAVGQKGVRVTGVGAPLRVVGLAKAWLTRDTGPDFRTGRRSQPRQGPGRGATFVCLAACGVTPAHGEEGRGPRVRADCARDLDCVTWTVSDGAVQEGEAKGEVPGADGMSCPGRPPPMALPSTVLSSPRRLTSWTLLPLWLLLLRLPHSAELQGAAGGGSRMGPRPSRKPVFSCVSGCSPPAG